MKEFLFLKEVCICICCIGAVHVFVHRGRAHWRAALGACAQLIAARLAAAICMGTKV